MTKEKLRQLIFLNEDIERLSDLIKKCDDMKTNGCAADDKSEIFIDPNTFNDDKVLQLVCDRISDSLSLVYDKLTRDFEEA